MGYAKSLGSTVSRRWRWITPVACLALLALAACENLPVQETEVADAAAACPVVNTVPAIDAASATVSDAGAAIDKEPLCVAPDWTQDFACHGQCMQWYKLSVSNGPGGGCESICGDPDGSCAACTIFYKPGIPFATVPGSCETIPCCGM
jgi:hypothetical protein